MRRIFVVASGVLMAASPSAAQDNPFAFTGGSVKSAYIVYDLRSKEGAVQGATWESGVAPDRWIVRMTLPVDLGGKKDTMRSLVIVTRDSQYKYNTMGLQRGDGEVSPTLRFHLAREYAALDAGGKARFKENLRSGTVDNSSASDDMDAFILLTGDKVGSETVAGHKCDVYKRKTFTACVMPHAPMVMLKWSDTKQNMNLVAKKVTLNGPIPTVASLRPKAVRWKRLTTMPILSWRSGPSRRRVIRAPCGSNTGPVRREISCQPRNSRRASGNEWWWRGGRGSAGGRPGRGQ